MPFTPEQARAELARRELARRGINPTQQPAPVPDKSFLRNAAEMVVDSPIIPIAAGTGAGLAGLATGPGAIALAGTAAAGAEGWRQILARQMGLPVPQTSMGALKDIAVQGAAGAAGEGGAQLIGAGLKTAAGIRASKAVGETLSRGAELATNVPAQDVARVAENPSSFLDLTRFGKAKAALAAEREYIGVPKALTNEAIDQLGRGQDFALDVVKRINGGEAVQPLEAYNAIDALDRSMPVKTKFNASTLRRLAQAREVLSEHLATFAPTERAAAQEYAIAQAGDKMHSLLPRGNNGKYLLIRSGLMAGGGLGGYRSGGNWESALGGALALSPLGIGTATASLGLAAQAAPALIRSSLGFATQKGLKTQEETQ